MIYMAEHIVARRLQAGHKHEKGKRSALFDRAVQREVLRMVCIHESRVSVASRQRQKKIEGSRPLRLAAKPR